MKSKTKAILKDLEEYITIKSYKLPIFKGYTAVNKRGIEQFIDTLYATLPEDVYQARQYLKSLDIEPENHKEGKNEIYDNIRDLESELDTSVEVPLTFSKYAIVNINKLEQILDKIYTSLPKELTTIEKLNK